MNDAWTWGTIINSSSWKEKKGGKKALHLPQKPWCEQQSAIPGSESKPKLSNHTYFFLCGAKSCSCQAIYLLSD